MGKTLAIRGHSTRGEEVIELLEMLGGDNAGEMTGYTDDGYYFIRADNEIDCKRYNIVDNNLFVFTLEKFLEKYPHKVGDKVADCYRDLITIKSMKWSNDFETMVYDFEETEDVLCAEDIESVNDTDDNTKPSKMKSVLAELLEHIKTTPKEELEREFEELEEWSNVGPTVEEFRIFCECVNRKPKYPKTYRDCCDVLNLSWNKCFVMFDIDHNGLTDKENNLYESLIKLKRCRDAYWKIAGEEMGLDGSWEPNWPKTEERKFCIIRRSDNVVTKYETKTTARFLAFPTEEMRDAFYENFKDSIEQCKELL